MNASDLTTHPCQYWGIFTDTGCDVDVEGSLLAEKTERAMGVYAIRPQMLPGKQPLITGVSILARRPLKSSASNTPRDRCSIVVASVK